MLVFWLLLAGVFSAEGASVTCGENCDPSLCRGPWTYTGSNRSGVCCLPNVGDKCRECRKNGKCQKCQRHYMLLDGKCYKKCKCRETKRKVGQQCCPRCANPCQAGLECVQQGINNYCVSVTEYEYEPDTQGPTLQPSTFQELSPNLKTHSPSRKLAPSKIPIGQPTHKPTQQPTPDQTKRPTRQPTTQPVNA